MNGAALRVGVSALFDPAVTPHAQTFLRAMAAGRNGIAALQRLHWHWLDDGADPEQGARVAERLIDWGADLVIGHFSSDAALAAAPLYRQAGVALLTPAATVDRLTTHDNVLRLCPADRQLASDLLAWVARQGWQRLHVQADSSTHGQALAAAIVAALAAHGLQSVATVQQADAEVFAGRLRPSRLHWQARRAAGSQRPLLLTDDAVSRQLGAALVANEPTWAIGFDPGPVDCPAAGWHRQLFASEPATYYRETLRLLHVLGQLAERSWASRAELLAALHSECFITPLGPVAFQGGECQALRTCLWRLGPAGWHASADG